MKIDTKYCKDLIVKYCIAGSARISRFFIPPLSYNNLLKIQDSNNWKRINKRNDMFANCIIREFEYINTPFNNQLKCYVESDMTDSIILKVQLRLNGDICFQIVTEGG